MGSDGGRAEQTQDARTTREARSSHSEAAQPGGLAVAGPLTVPGAATGEGPARRTARVGAEIAETIATRRGATSACVQRVAAPGSAALVSAGRGLLGAAADVASASTAAAIARRGVAGATERLPNLAAIQRAFGPHDVSGLTVARDAAARTASASLGARAFTFGERVALPEGPDLRTEAHEATHYLQQRAGRVARDGAPGDEHERQADAVAERVVRGASAVDLLEPLADAADGAPAVQCLTTTTANIRARWGYDDAANPPDPPRPPDPGDPVFATLKQELAAYEGNPTIATTAALIAAAVAFRDVFPPARQPPVGDGLKLRVLTNLKALIDEAHADLDGRLRAHATDVQNGNTAEARIASAVGNLPGAQRDERGKILKYQQRLGFAGARLDAVAADDGPAIIQSWQARGDMYHVGAVLNLFPRLKVILYDIPSPRQVGSEAGLAQVGEAADRWKQACLIAGYYAQPGRVFYTHADGVAGKADKGSAYDFFAGVLAGKSADAQKTLFIDVGGCTTIIGLDLQKARSLGSQAYATRRDELAAAVAPDPKGGDGRADRVEIKHFLSTHGWRKNTKYVIINFRGSGHSYIEKKLQGARPQDRAQLVRDYDPIHDQIGGNHPDLDTGVGGVKQLAKIVRERGFVPVFMGEEPRDQQHPHLIEYWKFEHVYPPNQPQPPPPSKLCRGARTAEAFFIRVLAEEYDVRLLSMRSGVTDQLAFLNIPTISIDVDNFHQASQPELLDKPGYEVPSDVVAHSWARGSKLEAGLERDYGRVFLSEGRDLKDFDQSGKWKGRFSQRDAAAIDDAVGFFWGTRDKAAPESLGIRHASHPLHPDRLEATAVGHEHELRAALPGKIDTGLNPDLVLAHVAKVLGPPYPDVAQATKFLDSHLKFTRVPLGQVADDEAGHVARKLEQQLEFLSSACVALADHEEAEKYQTELDRLSDALAANGVRLGRVKGVARTLLAQRAEIDTALTRRFDAKDRKVAIERAAFAQIDVKPITDLLAVAEVARNAESEAAFKLRMAPLVAAMATVYDQLRQLCQGAAQRLTGPKDLYYAKPFADAEAVLKEVVRPAPGLYA